MPFIIYTSTYTSPTDAKLAQAVGADKYLTKPCPTATLLTALDEVTKAGRPLPVEPGAIVEETYVLKQYNQALVNKLEEKNAELQRAIEVLGRAKDRIVEQNSSLEQRVKERTAELEAANQKLTQALSEVKQLNELLPICSYCKKIRDDKNYWQTVELYITEHSNSRFSHGICPECFEKHLKPDLEKALAAPAADKANKLP